MSVTGIYTNSNSYQNTYSNSIQSNTQKLNSTSATSAVSTSEESASLVRFAQNSINSQFTYIPDRYSLESTIERLKSDWATVETKPATLANSLTYNPDETQEISKLSQDIITNKGTKLSFSEQNPQMIDGAVVKSFSLSFTTSSGQ